MMTKRDDLFATAASQLSRDAAVAPAAVWGGQWSDLGASSTVAFLVAAVTGGLLGASTWPVFHPASDRCWTFPAVFGAAVGLLAGTFACGPVGGLFASAAGLAVGLGVHFSDLKTSAWALPRRTALSFVVGCSLSATVAWGLTL